MKFGPRRFACLPEVDDEVLVSLWNRAAGLQQIVMAIRGRHPQPVDVLLLWPGRSPGWKYVASRTGTTAVLMELSPAEYDHLRTFPSREMSFVAGLVKHGSGRRLTDCEGFAYLSAALLH